MLLLLDSCRTLRLTSPGRLVPWLGPALRGLVAGRFKENVCRHSPAEQETTWLRCKQQTAPRLVCPHLRTCPYGLTVEAEPPEPAHVFSGQEDGVRPFVFSPYFPLPEQARLGLAVPVLARFFGVEAAACVAQFWLAVEQAGHMARLGPNAICFTVEEAGPDRWRWLDLPRDPAALGGELPLVRVELRGPLLLRRGASEGRSREMLYSPNFADLLRAGLRTLGALCRGSGRPLDVDFAALREAAERVPLIRAGWRRFSQRKWSHRGQQGNDLLGVIGEAVFGPVPAALVRWLVAAGLAHVGLHRVAGAGGWRVHWSPDGGKTWEEMD